MKNLMLFILLIIGNIIYAQDSIKTQTPILDKTEHLVDKYSSKIADTFISTMESAKPFVKESFQTVVMLQIAKGIGYLLPLVFFFIFFNLMINEYKRIDNILKGVNILDPMTNDIIFMFDSVTEAAKFINCQSTNISKASKNKNKIVKGYKIEYNIKEQENLETNLEDNQDE